MALYNNIGDEFNRERMNFCNTVETDQLKTVLCHLYIILFVPNSNEKLLVQTFM